MIYFFNFQAHAKVWHSYNDTWRSEQQGNKESFCDYASIYLSGLQMVHKVQNCCFVV